MSIFDTSFPIEARRAVPIRELARSASALIDRVERDGEIIALSRYGRIVAVLAPTPEKLIVAFEKEDGPTLPSENDGEVGDIELPEWLEKSVVAQALLLRALTVHPMPYSVDGHAFPIKDVLVAKTRLELADFGDQTWRGSFLTPLGVAAAHTLRRRLDRENQRPA